MDTLKLGITGGIGSGKTTVCRIFEGLGIPVYYADVRAKKILQVNREVKTKIKALLGSDVYFSNGRPNRPYIASKVFRNKGLLEKLNAIVHPAVHEDFDSFFQQWNHRVPYVLNEAALIIENGSYTRFKGIIVVTCPEEIRLERVMQRDKKSKEEVLRRMKNQWTEAEKVKYADFLIDNSGEQSLIPQVWAIHQKIMADFKV